MQYGTILAQICCVWERIKEGRGAICGCDYIFTIGFRPRYSPMRCAHPSFRRLYKRHVFYHGTIEADRSKFSEAGYGGKIVVGGKVREKLFRKKKKTQIRTDTVLFILCLIDVKRVISSDHSSCIYHQFTYQIINLLSVSHVQCDMSYLSPAVVDDSR
jgi:hypothetical protein